MKYPNIFILRITALLLIVLLYKVTSAQTDYTKFVDRFIGTAGNGCVSPVAVVPFGMVQCGPNTHTSGSGYQYEHDQILGFSHINKSGGGCGDFLDILFVPLNADRFSSNQDSYPKEGFPTKFSHLNEKAEPGYYSVLLDGIKTELTASSRCAFHSYNFPNDQSTLAIDLFHGNEGACTIVPEDGDDKILSSGFRILDSVSVEGWRISSGWSKEQHVYFYARFSKPFSKSRVFKDGILTNLVSEASGTRIQTVLNFNLKGSNQLSVKVGISAVSCEGARKNLDNEMTSWDFNQYRMAAKGLWNTELSRISIKSDDIQKKKIFYTSLFNVFLYPMLYSDVDGKFRGPDHLIHETNGFNYYGGVVGLWDTFRAAIPLISLLRPDVMNDYVLTLLEHYKYFGQLPIWTLAGNETFQMIGIHSIPVITDCYLKGIRGYDIETAYEAMKQSLMKDTIGYSMRYFVGLINYKKYGYVPADLEKEATARTLEYAYDDWCMAQMANSLGKTDDYRYFIARSENFKNVFDQKSGFMNGRFSNGEFRNGLNPYYSNHRRDDFCEGNAWQWTFFVPHDIDGLAALMGGKENLANKLGLLFSESSKIEGDKISHDISGLIGQYAHGNEPSHHIAYMYNQLGEPHKTQRFVHEILTNLYDDTPSGLCGNEDTGQMSAWYVFSSLGFYPMNPSSQNYEIGSPLFKKSVIHLPNGNNFKIEARNQSDENHFIKSKRLNGKELKSNSFSYQQLLNGSKLILNMTDGY